MPPRYVVVDGSNIATEGRSVPSLSQLDEAVRAFMEERPTEQVIVVVDASFGYRIDESERSEYEAAEAAGEIVSPPAGAIGRGDGFLLRIADRTGAVVLSNDSFQEFHAEYGWLFDQGRLIGGKPVPGVGWIFTPRAPVRGPRSREAIRQARRVAKSSVKRAAVADGPVAEAIAEATAEVQAPGGDEEEVAAAVDAGSGGRRVRRRHTKPGGAVNDPLPFIQFIADHRLGSEVEGEVETFTSHGAFVNAAGARCYIPLVALGDPPPRSAKTVLKRGVPTVFVVQALDAPRRGIELALPGLARVAGVPTEETVEADIGAGRKPRAAAPEPEAEAGPDAATKPARRRTRKAAAGVEAVAEVVATEAAADETPEPVAKPARKRTRKAAAPPVDVVEGAEAVAAIGEAVAEPAPQEPPVKRARSRKKAAEPALEALSAPARKPAARRKAVQPDVEAPAPETAPAEAAPAIPEPAPAAATPAIRAPRRRVAAKKVAAPAPPEPAPAPEAAPAKRSRKKAVAEAAPEAAPVKRGRKKPAG